MAVKKEKRRKILRSKDMKGSILWNKKGSYHLDFKSRYHYLKPVTHSQPKKV